MAITKQDFLQKIRTKYPAYDSVEDDVLYDKMLTKYPSYKDQIQEVETPQVDKWSGLWEAALRAAKPITKVPWTIVWAWVDIAKDVASGLRSFWADIRRIGADEPVQAPWEGWIKPWLLGRTRETFQEVWADVKAARTAQEAWAVVEKEGILQREAPQSKAKSLLQSMGIIWLGVSDTIADTFISWLKTLAPESVEETVKEWLQEAMKTKPGEAIQSEVQEALDWYEHLKETDPEKARDYKAFFGWLSLAADVLWITTVAKLWAKETGKQVIKKTVKEAVTPPIPIKKAPIVPKKGQGIIQGARIEAVTPEPVAPKWIIAWAKARVEKWPQEFIGKVWEKPVIKPLETIKPKVSKGIDVAKSDDLIRRGLKPSVAGKTTEYAYNKVNKDITEGIEYVARSKGVATDWMDAFKKTAARKRDVYKTIENNNDLVTKTTKISDIEGRLNKYFTTKEWKAFSAAHPWMREQIKSTVDNWIVEYGDDIVQKDMQLLKQEYNKTLAKGDFAKMMQTPTKKSLADAKIAQTLWNILDDNVMEVLWKTNKALNKEYGSLRTLEKNLARRMWVFNRNTKGWMGWLLDTFNAWDIVMWMLTGDVKQAWLWITRKVALATVKRAENPNRMIKQLFEMHWPKKPTLGQKIQKITGKEDVDVTLKPKAKLKALPQKSVVPKKRAVTVKAKEKAVIAESKKGLEKAKIGTTKAVWTQSDILGLSWESTFWRVVDDVMDHILWTKTTRGLWKAGAKKWTAPARQPATSSRSWGSFDKAPSVSQKQRDLIEIQKQMDRAAVIAEKSVKIKANTIQWNKIERIKKLWTLKGSSEVIDIIDSAPLPKAMKDLMKEMNNMTQKQFTQKMQKIIEKAEFKKSIKPLVRNFTRLYIASHLWDKEEMSKILKILFPKPKGLTPLKSMTPRW